MGDVANSAAQQAAISGAAAARSGPTLTIMAVVAGSTWRAKTRGAERACYQCSDSEVRISSQDTLVRTIGIKGTRTTQAALAQAALAIRSGIIPLWLITPKPLSFMENLCFITPLCAITIIKFKKICTALRCVVLDCFIS